MSRFVNRGTRRGLGAAGAVAIAAAGVAALVPSTSTASSHREAPLVAGDPLVDNTDTYAFVSPDSPDTVTLIANWIPFQEPSGGPNFYPWAEADEARYNIKLDTDGDAVPDLTYRWEFTSIDTRDDVDYPLAGQPQGDPDADGSFIYNIGPVESFDDPDLLFKQTYTLTVIDGDGTETELVADAPVAPSHVGDASMPDYQALRDEAVVDVGDGITSFVGQAEDPFFLDLRVFDLLYGADLSEVGNDTLARYNVNSVALQVPIDSLGLTDDIVGVWSTTDRASLTTRAADGSSTPSGEFVQVSRLGQPLVNELVIPAGLKDAFNALAPEDDASVTPAVNKVLNPEVPYLLNAVYGLEIPETPRQDLFSIFLTGLNGLNQPTDVTPSEMLRLNTSVAPSAEPDRLGVLAGDNAGFPNGRRLTDDVVDIALQAVAGAVSVDETGAPTGVSIVEPLAAGDAVDQNQVAFGDSFPYLALPNSGSSVGAVAPGETTTETVTVTATAGGGGGGGRGGGGGGGEVMPTGGIDTGDARSAAGSSALVTSGVVLLVALGGAATYALRRKRSLGLHQ